MKANCPREELLLACQLVSAAVSANKVKAILNNLKVVASSEGCTILATDLELGVRHELRSLQVTANGEALLPAAKLVAILRESTDDEVSIDADEERVLVRGQSTEFEMAAENPDEFPDVPMFVDTAYHQITSGVLREMIRRTVFAAAKESAKYAAMTGVLWEFEGTHVRLVATDSRRLALANGLAEAIGGHNPKGQSHVVPPKALAVLDRSLNDDDEPVKVSLHSNVALFRTGRTTVYCRLVEGRFPPYRDILPKKSTAKVPLAVAPFLAAVRQAAVMTDEDSKKVNFKFTPGKLTLLSHGVAAGRSKVELPVEYEGAPLEINFDPQFLVDMLRVLNEETPLVLELQDGSKPALFKSGADYSYLVMPLS